jgi:hypothetical protein
MLISPSAQLMVKRPGVKVDALNMKTLEERARSAVKYQLGRRDQIMEDIRPKTVGQKIKMKKKGSPKRRKNKSPKKKAKYFHITSLIKHTKRK